MATSPKLMLPDADVANFNAAFGDIDKPEMIETDAYPWRIGTLFETGTGLSDRPIYLGALFYLRVPRLDAHGTPVWQKYAFFGRDWSFKLADHRVLFWQDLGDWLDRDSVGMRTWEVDWVSATRKIKSAVSYSFETRLLRSKHR